MMYKYRYPTELLHVYPSGMREIEAANDIHARHVARKYGADIDMNNLQIWFKGKWRNLERLRLEFAETQRMITESDCRTDIPSHDRA